MEKTYKRVPFDIELAKKIQSGEVEGRIVTVDGNNVRILCYDAKTLTENRIIALVSVCGCEYVGIYFIDGRCYDKEERVVSNIVIELPEETPKHEFKPFDKVLVREDCMDDGSPDIWVISLYMDECCAGYRMINGEWFDQCIPYEGNEHLAGTTDEPK